MIPPSEGDAARHEPPIGGGTANGVPNEKKTFGMGFAHEKKTEKKIEKYVEINNEEIYNHKVRRV